MAQRTSSRMIRSAKHMFFNITLLAVKVIFAVGIPESEVTENKGHIVRNALLKLKQKQLNSGEDVRHRKVQRANKSDISTPRRPCPCYSTSRAIYFPNTCEVEVNLITPFVHNPKGCHLNYIQKT